MDCVFTSSDPAFKHDPEFLQSATKLEYAIRTNGIPT